MLMVGENSVRAVTALMSLHVLDQPHLVLPPMPVGPGALLQLSSGGGLKAPGYVGRVLVSNSAIAMPADSLGPS